MVNSRTATFSSSAIHSLCKGGNSEYGFGDKAMTYIKEKRYEKKLNRPLHKEVFSKPTIWGQFLEKLAFELLPELGIRLDSKNRLVHKTINQWTGAPDTIDPIKVGDIKCPYSLKSFCKTIEAFETRDTEKFKELKPEYYWQLVSNSILSGRPICESIIYVPYESELEVIRHKVNNYEGELDINKIMWINFALNEDLPYILDGGYYTNINRFEFEVPKEDRDFLTERVQKAIIILNRK